jgi:magnesium/cobalt transport protein CorA
VSTKAILSDAQGNDESVDLASISVESVDSDQLLWIDLEDPSEDELDTLKRTLRLPDDTWEAVRNEPQKADAFNREGAIEVVLVALADELRDAPVPLQILVGDVWIVTRHSGPMAFLDEHRDRVMDQREVGMLTPLELFISVLEWHVDSFFAAAEKLEGEVDRLDDAALGSERDILDRMVRTRRHIARVRRILTPHRAAFAEITRPDFLPALDEPQRGALVQVQQRLDMAAEAISNARDMLLGTFDVYMTRTAQRTNDIMRVLTLASVILLPSVVVAGVMGMNFKVGLFDDPNMFWVVLGVMALMALATLLVARWRGWL